MDEEWEKCPRCLEDRKDDWDVPDIEWKRYVPKKWWGENLCVSCYLFLVRCKIEGEGQGFCISYPVSPPKSGVPFTPPFWKVRGSASK